MGAAGDAGVVDPRTRYEIWLTCDDCGDVVVMAERCTLRREPLLGCYTLAFPCPSCRLRSAIEVDARSVMRLLAAGFEVHRGRTPAELREARPSGPPFTTDDVLAFHEVLATTTTVPPSFEGV